MKSHNEPRIYYGYIVVLIACLILTVTQGTYFSFGVFFKPLLEDFGWTRAMTSGAFSICSILVGLLHIITGRLNDRIGPRFVMTVCGIFLGIGYLLMSRIGALWQFYLIYGAIIAMGMSGGYIPLTSTVSRWFVKRRGLMTGIVAAGTGFGTLIVPPIASRLIVTYDWRDSYSIVGIAAIIIIVLASQFLRRDPSQVGQLPDGEKEAKAETTGIEPMSYSFAKAVRTRQFGMLLSINFFFCFCLLIIMVHIVPHITDLGISVAKATNIIAIIGGAGVIGRISMGGVGDRIGNKRAIATCYALVLITVSWLMIANEPWQFYLFAAVFGFAYGGLATLGAPLLADLFGLGSHGTIYGSSSFGATLGGAVGPVMAGRIFDVTGSYQLAFITCTIFSAIALVLILLLKPTTKPSKKDEL